MSDLETFVWIIFGVIYVISRILKERSKQKKMKRPGMTKPPAQRPVSQQPATEQKAPKKSFFDEILKEIEKNLAGDEEREPGPPQPKTNEREPEPIPQEWQEAQPVVKSLETTTSSYTNIGGRDYMEERKQHEIEMVKFSHTDTHHEIKREYSFYGELLQDPEELKRAIVLNEILNRKYF